MKLRVFQSADGQGVLSLDGVLLANRKRDWSEDRGGGGDMCKKGKFDNLLNQFWLYAARGEVGWRMGGCRRLLEAV